MILKLARGERGGELTQTEQRLTGTNRRTEQPAKLHRAIRTLIPKLIPLFILPSFTLLNSNLLSTSLSSS